MQAIGRPRVLFAVLVMIAATFSISAPVNADGSLDPSDGISESDGSQEIRSPGVASTADGHERAAAANTARERTAERTAAAAAARRPGVAELVQIAGIDGVSCNYFTVEAAISAAPAGGTVYIAPGTYPAATQDLDYNIDKDLNLVKGSANCHATVGGSSTTVVLKLHPASTIDAVVEVLAGADVRLDRITIDGGNSAEGTVFVDNDAKLTLDDAVVRNGNNPSASAGGGGVRVDPGASLSSINGSQVVTNNAVRGGGVYVEDGAVTTSGDSPIAFNDASDGAGIYGVAGAGILVEGGADVIANTATGEGGGVYVDDSSFTANGAGTVIASNDATLGGGLFATNGATAIIRASASVQTNTANFGGGVYALTSGTSVRLIDGSVLSNSVSSNGGGMLVTVGALADITPHSSVSGNTATGSGGGIAVFTPALLLAKGGTPFLPVQIYGNVAGGDGGGIWASGSLYLDTVFVSGNTATNEGGGLYASGAVNITEELSCQLSTLAFEQYCNEFRANTAGTTGGAIYSSGAYIAAVQVGFVDNEADAGAVLMAVGASTVNIKASVAILNTETVVGGDGLVTAQGTTALTLVGFTFADNNEGFLDTDDSATATVSRVLTTTGTLGLVATPAGTCNVSAVAANLSDLTVADPQLVTKDKSDYIPDADSEAVDACNAAGGLATDSRDTAIRDGNGVNSATEFDIGGLEAPTPK